MERRKLGSQGLVVATVRLGCMRMSNSYGATKEAEAIATIHRALDLGVTLLDTADVYGPFTLNDIAPKGAAAGPRYADMSSVNR